jgi:hypothetical protein
MPLLLSHSLLQHYKIALIETNFTNYTLGDSHNKCTYWLDGFKNNSRIADAEQGTIATWIN